MTLPHDKDILNPGFIVGKDKYDAISASQFLINPSYYESLSIVILEAWSCGIPVLVNGNCEVLKNHCLRSNGGLWYENYDEFKECLDLLLSNKNLRKKLGENGKKYVKKNYNWNLIEKNISAY